MLIFSVFFTTSTSNFQFTKKLKKKTLTEFPGLLKYVKLNKFLISINLNIYYIFYKYSLN